MLEELLNEVEAINSIYGDGTLQEVADGDDTPAYLLSVPSHQVTLRLSFPSNYPDAPVEISRVDSTGNSIRKGHGIHVLTAAQAILRRSFVPGQVCLFDLLQELEGQLSSSSIANDDQPGDGLQQSGGAHQGGSNDSKKSFESVGTSFEPQWKLSDPVTEKKSVFLGRCCVVNSGEEVQAALSHLLSTDKRAAKATHNISAYRIRQYPSGSEVLYQDYDDDGEDAAGARLLKLLQMMGVWNVLVVVSRWYGGIKLGPARFGIINAVARQAVVSGGYPKG
ncbi:MAG: hypothetical protein Q9190_006652 [Brigantiaea leucoxantha]